ncbi:uncharacterized protein LOC123629815 [Lemur catta]|uniref:uncharacterized protein LOC123629815 n=1 Tax=Lemur catta TaxID=9447 RepID=UPI001E267651|nr:uncharacterized protein LOC123629815 [Lemur catta]XP_045395150.1 uncharacterized protein LOC123629815 [Lemur catta]XP_045395151.1 uncharacterized protein LOC123629815 [Lemur catta]XP_045395152.1 uncharacterized protein LOC123629815 [Lemur catta]XP_045395153.1 uncharacterized protein LOC123629815 [Lemur catta]XP_045395154.1 uncharacterized protein LOC123629815 [Lemur catta]XP_045395155.1 uncharacterized protein LOC123629815 [Lemur catta]XP_045395156.1 uncharacterized protein LOC123629815 [
MKAPCTLWPVLHACHQHRLGSGVQSLLVGPILYPTRLSSVEQEEKVNGVLQSQLGEGHLTSASHRDLCDTDQPPCTGAILFDEQGVSRALDAATTRGDSNTQEGQEPMETGLSGEEEEANPTQQTSLHEQRVTLSSGQDLSESRCPSRCPAARCRRDCACPGPAENYEEEEDEEDLESLASSVPSELQEDAGTTGLSQALTEQGFPPGGADLSDCRELIRSATSLSAEPEAESVLDGAGGLSPRALEWRLEPLRVTGASCKHTAAAKRPGD